MILGRNNPLQKPRSSTAVNYIVKEDNEVFLCMVYDFRLMDALVHNEESLIPAILGVVVVTTGDCEVLYGGARGGYGPLTYDMAARGLARYIQHCDALEPSDAQSLMAQSFWARIEQFNDARAQPRPRRLFPLTDNAFLAKYGVLPQSLEKLGRKMSRTTKMEGLNNELYWGAMEAVIQWLGKNSPEVRGRVMLSRELESAGYRQ